MKQAATEACVAAIARLVQRELAALGITVPPLPSLADDRQGAARRNRASVVRIRTARDTLRNHEGKECCSTNPTKRQMKNAPAVATRVPPFQRRMLM